jgi:DNA polymerase-3 subunit alpha
MNNWVHLHVHTEYSPLDGLSKIEELCRVAKDFGMPGIAVTDHGTCSGHHDLQKYADKYGIKPIFGCEYYMLHPDKSRSHITVFAKNNIGLRNMYRLLELANTEGFYKKPNITYKHLIDNKEGLIVTTACLAGKIPQYILEGNLSTAKISLSALKKEFGDDFYIEIQPNSIPEQFMVNKQLVKFSNELGIKIIPTNDVHYTYKEDADVHEVLLALQTKKKMSDPKRFKFSTQDFWFKNKEEMLEGFVGIDADILERSFSNTLEIMNKCDARLEKGHYLPRFHTIPEGKTERDLLEEVTWKGFSNLYNLNVYDNHIIEELRKDVEHELDVIDRNGYSGYFLVVQDYANHARDNKILVGEGRGSGAGCKVAYCSGITEVDPYPYGLLFERFLADGREPDFDIDFSDQEFIFKYLQSKYGERNVARIMAFGTLSAKAVCRKVMSCFDYSMSEIAITIGQMPQRLEFSLADAYKENKHFAEFMDKNPFIWRVMQRLEDVISHESQHAGGMLIVENLCDVLPVKYGLDSQGNRTIPIACFDKKMLEALGHFKFDVLGLKTLPTVRRTLDMIEETGEKVVLKDIDYEDAEVYDALCKGDVSGVFQLANQASKVMEQKPRNFRDLIAINALIRPGVGDWNEYLARRNGKDWYTQPERQGYMKETVGLLTYQEQFLLDCKTFAGWGIAYADSKVRKNKDINNDTELKEKFINDSINRGFKQEVVEHIWKEICEAVSGGYSFNKSHSCSYARLSYQTMWLKVKYPTFFYASLLTTELGDQDEVSNLIAECKRKGIRILPPNINNPSHLFTASKEGISIPINYLKGIGEDVVTELERLAPITSLQDMLDRMIKKNMRKTAIVAMIKAGCFDFENEDRTLMMWKYEMTLRKKTDIKNGIGCNKLEWTEKLKLDWEKNVLGMYLSKHPLENHNLYPLDSVNDNTECLQVLEITDIAERMQKNGKPFAFITGSNQYGTVKCLCFNSQWEGEDGNEGYKDKIEEGNILIVKGKRSGTSLIVNEIEQLQIS